ncbi:MAG TPA: hypothetical protein VEW93_02405 [Acidimicrobiales bacterium]|nr:hypothetical protein [Acidimicrobiales bacterium]
MSILGLRAPTDDDRPWMVAALANGHRSQRWSLRGLSPSPGLVESLLRDQVATQAVAAPPGRPGLALFQVVKVHEPTHSADLELITAPGDLTLVRDTLARFTADVFASGGLRRLILATLDGHADVAALLPGATPSLRLREQEWTDDGVLSDLLVHELWAPEASP